MDKPETLQSGHLSEPALEAWAGGRDDLIDAPARAHLSGCAECSQRLEEARRDQAVLHAALPIEIPAEAIDALVLRALEPERPSARSLVFGALVGGAIAVTLGLLSMVGSALPTPGTVWDALGHAWTLLAASNRVVEGSIPGGWAMLSVLLAACVTLSLAPLRALVGRRSGSTLAAAVVLLGLFTWTETAHALDFTGTWPEGERISVTADGVPASVALEQAAGAAGLGFVGVLSADPVVHVRVREASLRDVITAIVGSDAPLVCERSASLLIIHAAEPARQHTDEPSAPVSETVPSPASDTVPAASPSAPATPPEPNRPRSGPRERVAFGGNVVVARGEVVESAAAMGGNVTIEGEVLEDAVAFGGQLLVRPGGLVHGDAAAMGGDVHVEPGGAVHGETTAFGGEVRNEGSAPTEEAEAEEPEEPESPTSELAAWIEGTFASGARHALLFLFGLLLLGLWPARLERVAAQIVRMPGRAAATGALGMIASILLMLLLVITIVGIPGAILLAIAGALAGYGGLVAVAVVVGRAMPIAALDRSPLLRLGAGVVVFFVASRVPLVGGLLLVASGLVGFGAVLLTRGGVREPE